MGERTLYSIKPNTVWYFNYKNHRGETKRREVKFLTMQFGSNEYYPESSWFFFGWDYERQGHRSFEISRIELDSLEPRDLTN